MTQGDWLEQASLPGAAVSAWASAGEGEQQQQAQAQQQQTAFANAQKACLEVLGNTVQ